MIQLLAFDADDTLWHNETHFREAEEAFYGLLEAHHARDYVAERLLETELRNLRHYGYGIKGFTLSLIETALDLTGETVTGAEMRRIMALGQAMLSKPVEPLPGVRETLEALSGRYALMLVTKGDLFDQEAKLARSGLGELFSHVEIVSEKTADTYGAILKRQGVKPGHFCMVGNSLKSDVLPAVRIGARGVHVPYAMTWVHEQVEGAAPHSHGYAELASITELPALLERWEAE